MSSVDTGDSRRRLCSFLNSRFSALRDSTSGACCKYICRAFHCGYPIRSKNLGAKLSGTYALTALRHRHEAGHAHWTEREIHILFVAPATGAIRIGGSCWCRFPRRSFAVPGSAPESSRHRPRIATIFARPVDLVSPNPGAVILLRLVQADRHFLVA
jgi:hypothetical protein